MLTQIKSSKGFTLPELIIGGALLALLLGAVFNIISTAYRINENTTVTNQNIQTTKQVMLYLFPEMETVTAINGSTNNTVTCNLNQSITYSKNINNTIVNCSITLNNNTVTLTKGSTSQTILATGIQSITLNRHNTNNRMVQISITANNNNSSYTLQQRVVTLNNNDNNEIWQ